MKGTLTEMARQAAVKTLAEVSERIDSLATHVSALGVRRLAVFGSLARGMSTPSSDVDVLVEFVQGEKRLDRLLALCDLLEEAFGRAVDVVTTDGLSPRLRPHILAEARDVL